MGARCQGLGRLCSSLVADAAVLVCVGIAAPTFTSPASPAVAVQQAGLVRRADWNQPAAAHRTHAAADGLPGGRVGGWQGGPASHLDCMLCRPSACSLTPTAHPPPTRPRSLQPRLGVVTRSLAHAGPDLLHFGLVFGLVFAGYAMLAFLVFGNSVAGALGWVWAGCLGPRKGGFAGSLRACLCLKKKRKRAPTSAAMASPPLPPRRRLLHPGRLRQHLLRAAAGRDRSERRPAGAQRAARWAGCGCGRGPRRDAQVASRSPPHWLPPGPRWRRRGGRRLLLDL